MRGGALLAALACVSAPRAQVMASIGGQVYNSATDDFVNGATVILTDTSGAQPAQSFTTATRGLFLFENLPPGRYQLLAECPGFARAALGARGNSLAGATLSLVDSQQMNGLVFALTPASSVSGVVTDSDGAPLAARVFALQPVYQRGKKELVPLASAATDAQGNFKLQNLGAGDYTLAATDATGANAATFAESITIPPAASVTGKDIRMKKATGRRVLGKLEGASKPAIAWLTPKGGATSLMLRRPAKVQDDNDFVFENVAPGAYLLNATETDGVTPAAAPIPVTVAQKDLEGLTLRADAGTELDGEVSIGAAIAALPPGIQVILETADAPMPRPARASVDAHGKFTFPKLAAGRYFLHLLMPESLYVRLAHYRGVDAIDDGFEFTGASGGQLLIGVSATGASIGGTVRGADGSPLPGATVALIPNLRRYSRYKEVTADQFGEYHFYGIAPGDYKVIAWDHIEPGQYQDAAWLKQYEYKGQSLVAKPGVRETLPLVAR